MILDSHQHVWDLSAADYPWLGPQHHPINRTIELSEAHERMAAYGVERTILVQAADDAAETQHLLRVADGDPRVAGVIGWVPLDQPSITTAMLASRDPRWVGVRSLIHDRPHDDWILGCDEGLAAVAQAGLPFDYVTASPGALRHVPGIAARHPSLRIVIDHLGKPPISGSAGGGSAEDLAQWRDLLAACAQHPQVYAKISGLYGAEGNLPGWSLAEVRSAVGTAVDLFGPTRVMWGTDWPVSELAGGYERVTGGLLGLLSEILQGEDLAAVLGGVAARCYGLQLNDELNEETA